MELNKAAGLPPRQGADNLAVPWADLLELEVLGCGTCDSANH